MSNEGRDSRTEEKKEGLNQEENTKRKDSQKAFDYAVKRRTKQSWIWVVG